MAQIDISKLSKFTQSYSLGDFDVTSNVTIPAGTTDDDYHKIGSFSVDSQTLATFGNGAITNGVDYRGLWKMDLNSAPSTPIVNLKIRLLLTNKKATRTRVIKEELSQNLVSGVKLGEYPQKAQEQDRLIIQGFSTTEVTITIADSTASIPITSLQ